jgi:protoporphyrinogen oxidase
MGLAAAHALARRGHRVTIFEADDRIGGMSAQFDFDGLPVERYYHFVCKPDEPLFRTLREFELLDKLRWRSTEMGFFYEGKLYDWGRPDCLLRFPHLDLVSKLRYALHVARAKTIRDWRPYDAIEATQWIRRWTGDRAFDVLWRKLFELKFFEHQGSLSAAWIGARIQRVARSRRDAFHEELGYLEGGSQTLLDAYATSLRALGATIELRSPVQRVAVDGGRARGVFVRGELRAADVVVSTVPMKLVQRIAHDLSAQEKRRIDAIDNIGVVCVVLKMTRPLTKYFWLNTNDRRLEIPGIVEYTNLAPLPAHVVYVPYYMPRSHPKWGWEAARFIDEVKRYLAIVRPGWDPATLLAAHASRYEFAQPVCGPGFRDRLPAMQTSIGGFFMADTAYYYPEDRSISESVRVGRELAGVAMGEP